ncbi:MAG: phosphatidate cytidylyltransferase [Pirellulales bacterium]
MLRWRLTLGCVFVAGLAGLCWLDAHSAPGAWLFPLWMVVCGLAADELWRLAYAAGHRPPRSLMIAAALAVGGAGGLQVYSLPSPLHLEPLGHSAAALALAAIVAFAYEIARYKQPGRATASLATVALAGVYVGLFGSFLLQLRLLGKGPLGLLALVSLIAVVKAGDIGAYTGGRLFGRHKMAPTLSPGKTWEGAASGLLFSVAAAWLVFYVLGPRLAPSFAPPTATAVVAFGLVISAAGMVGDLAESLLKRDCGLKDSSAWMPGFGGVLDLLDSILFAAPIAYLCWAAGLVG